MQNQEGLQVQVDGEVESGPAPSVATPEFDEWASLGTKISCSRSLKSEPRRPRKFPSWGTRKPLSSLAAEYQSGSAILLEENKGYLYAVLGEQYAAIRRTRGDGNCFFRSFMFSYLEHILESQDGSEVDRIKANVEQCRKTLQSLGYADFTFEDFFSLFLEQLDSVLQGNEESISHDELILRSRDQSETLRVFEPFIFGLTNATVEQFCKSSVEPMGEESDHVHITALSDALGCAIPVALRKISPFITLLYRPGHYDILYPK
ncbi:hypothetical protein M0R45_021410 [Rubus argutus]|uniref:ubiquitinyl hydrolase 1 n=1 Tax=Rubus argutus TaxID=59490 RepID=A0AAW1XDL8_RUBAR